MDDILNKLPFDITEEDLKTIYKEKLSNALYRTGSMYLDTPAEIKAMKEGYNKALELIAVYESKVGKFKQIAAPIDEGVEIENADDDEQDEALCGTD